MAIDQEESWMNLSGSEKQKSITGEPIIGQIFFATDDRKLDKNDVAVLENLIGYMKTYLLSSGPHLQPFTIGFIGWADHRGAETYNSRLSQERADMVRSYFDEQFIGNGGTFYWRTKYNSSSHGAGEGKLRGAGISKDRRVDITSNRKWKQRMDFEDNQIRARVKDKTLSRLFDFRVSFGYQFGIPGVEGLGVTFAFVEIRNPRNQRRIKLKFSGGGGGIGAPVGYSPSDDWQQVDVGYYMQVDDFEGRGEVASASAIYESSTIYCFYGPNDYGRTSEQQRLRDEPIKFKTSGAEPSLGVGSVTGIWERYQG